ncbi:MAG TPA: hypothetical protein VJK72_03070 [Candidatus Nanoarchaeia archaeon]|nr:hypothetical protein [Candidatus Nanoarchaeia archaeon]
MPRVALHLRVEDIVGEKVYSPVRLCEMMRATGLNNTPSDYTIRRYAQKKGLGVTPVELGIHCTDTSGGKTYFVKSSNLPKLIEGLGLAITPEQLEEAIR